MMLAPGAIGHGLAAAGRHQRIDHQPRPLAVRTLKSPGRVEGDRYAVVAPPTPAAAESGAAVESEGGVAVLPVDGPIWYSPTLLSCFWGGESTLGLVRALDEALDDPRVGTLVLDIHSPGGDAFGSSDLHDAAARFAEKKTLLALCRDLCASAAYGLACHAHEVVATPSAEVGSVGTMVLLYDTSGAAEKWGERAVPITDAEHKLTGWFGVPITDEMEAAERETIAPMARDFRELVTARRGLAPGTVERWAGRVFGASDALAEGLVDRVETTAAFYARVLAGDTTPPDHSNNPTPSPEPAPMRPESTTTTKAPRPAGRARRPEGNPRARTGATETRSRRMPTPSNKSPKQTIEDVLAAIDELDDENKDAAYAAIKAKIGDGGEDPEPEAADDPEDPGMEDSTEDPAAEDDPEQPGQRRKGKGPKASGGKNPWQGPVKSVIAHAKARLGTVGVAEDRRGAMAYAALEAGVDSDTALFAFAVQQAHDPDAAQRAAAAEASRGADAPLGGGRKGDGTGSGSGAVAAYRAAIDKRMQEAKCSRQAATRYVNTTMPEVKAAYVEAVTNEAAQAGALRRA